MSNRWDHFRGHETARGANLFFETLSDPETAYTGNPSKSPFNRAFGTEETLWETFEKPGHERELRRFGTAMLCGKEFDPVKGLLESTYSNICPSVHFFSSICLVFDWSGLPEGSKIVDVGGGIGTVSKLLADSQKHLNIIVQDRPAVVVDGLAVRYGPSVIAKMSIEFKFPEVERT